MAFVTAMGYSLLYEIITLIIAFGFGVVYREILKVSSVLFGRIHMILRLK